MVSMASTSPVWHEWREVPFVWHLRLQRAAVAAHSGGAATRLFLVAIVRRRGFWRLARGPSDGPISRNVFANSQIAKLFALRPVADEVRNWSPGASWRQPRRQSKCRGIDGFIGEGVHSRLGSAGFHVKEYYWLSQPG